MERSNFSSRTAEVKALITSFMAEQEKPVERKKIADYVLDHNVADVTDGVIAGAIKMMTASGELYPVQRGMYIRGTGKAKSTAYERIYNICKRFDCDLEKGCTFNILELTEAERTVYGEFSDCALELRNYVRERTEVLAAILEKVRGLEVSEAPAIADEAGPEIPGQSVMEGEAEFQTFEQDIASVEIPEEEHGEPDQGNEGSECVQPLGEADDKKDGAGKRGRRGKEK